MKFVELFYTVAVFGAFVNNVNATVEIGFSKQCGDDVTFSCSYIGGGKDSASACTGNIDNFADIINNLRGDTVSVAEVDREGINSNTDSYLIGDGKEMCDLITFDKLNTSGNVSKLSFNGKNVCGSPVSIQFNYDSAGDMALPVVKCNNIALVRINIASPGNVRCGMAGLETDVQTGIVYNNKLKINGKTFNNVSDVNSGSICLVASNGLNNIQQKPSEKVTLGKDLKAEARKRAEEFYKKHELAAMGIDKNGNSAWKKGGHYKMLDKKAWEQYKQMLNK